MPPSWRSLFITLFSPGQIFHIRLRKNALFCPKTDLIGLKPYRHILMFYSHIFLSLYVSAAPVNHPRTSVAKPPQQQPLDQSPTHRISLLTYYFSKRPLRWNSHKITCLPATPDTPQRPSSAAPWLSTSYNIVSACLQYFPDHLYSPWPPTYLQLSRSTHV